MDEEWKEKRMKNENYVEKEWKGRAEGEAMEVMA